MSSILKKKRRRRKRRQRRRRKERNKEERKEKTDRQDQRACFPFPAVVWGLSKKAAVHMSGKELSLGIVPAGTLISDF